MPKILPLSASPSSPLESSLRLPANKRLATPNAQRLNSITDPSASSSRATKPSCSDNGNTGNTGNINDASGAGETASPTPRRRSLASIRLALPVLRRESGSSKTSHPAPPYDWVPEPIEEGLDGRVPVEGEKLRRLRRKDDEGKGVVWWRRKRVVLLAIAVVLLVALAIGLGVGLSPRGQGGGKAQGAPSSWTEAPPLEFPLGQWTVGATLVEANTGCTSDSDIWRCYPYAMGGQTIFDLTITNTSALYAPNKTDKADTAASANLTISSSNAFAIPFANESLTYTSSPANASSARLEWTFEMDKSVMPSSPMMPNGGAAECTFPGTVLVGSLYLNAPRINTGTGEAGNGEWPYAYELRQSTQASGGAVECQGMSGGSVQVEGAGGVCDCVYRNY